jgi:hypothetical protein
VVFSLSKKGDTEEFIFHNVQLAITVFPGLSFPRRRESIKLISDVYFRTTSNLSGFNACICVAKYYTLLNLPS